MAPCQAVGAKSPLPAGTLSPTARPMAGRMALVPFISSTLIQIDRNGFPVKDICSRTIKMENEKG